nr:MAG TPA: hypothetical protein [Caudoviricetes sp.]
MFIKFLKINFRLWFFEVFFTTWFYTGTHGC